MKKPLRHFYKTSAALVIAFLMSSAGLFAQQPTDTLAGERTKFIGKISHWLAAYGASGEDFMREKRNAFKSAAFAEVYIEGIIDHPAWMFTMLNRVTQAKYAEKQTPYILFGIKFTPQDDNLNSYEISLSLQEGSAISPQRDDGIVSNASAKHLGGKTYAEPVAAEADLEKAIGEALDGLRAKLGNSLAPKLMVRYQDEVFWNGHEIPILDAEGNSVELEAIDRDGALLSPDEITWTNADPFQSRGVVDMTGTQTKAVTLSWGNDPMTVTLKRVSVSQDINELLKALIIEALTTKKQESLDSVTILKQDSIANAQAVAQAIRQLEAQNFPLEGGTAPVALFADGPRTMTAQDEGLFDDSPSRAESFRLLRARRDLRMRIRKKVNVVAFANLLVDRPDQVQFLLDALLRDSGRLIAQLVLNRNQDGLRESARNIVVDFLNRNLEEVAGGRFGFAQEVEPPLEMPVATTPASSQAFSASKFLYVNDLVAFEGKEAFITEIEAYLNTLPEPLYVFVNYSQDVSTESYLQRAPSTRPRGLPEGAKYVTLTLVNIPGSVKYQVVGSQQETFAVPNIALKDLIIEYIKGEQQVLYTEETKEQEVARIINYIKCGRSSSKITVKVHYGLTSYSVRVGAIANLLDFAGYGTLASPEFNNAILTLGIGGGAFSADEMIIGYDDIVLNLSGGQYSALQKLQIPATIAGGAVFRFPQISDVNLRQSLFNWLLEATGFNGAPTAHTINNSAPITVEKILLYSECELAQLSRSNRESVVDELLKMQHGWLGLDRDTYQYLLLYVLETTPEADRLYFYEYFKQSPAKIRKLYLEMSRQNTPRLIRFWLTLWERVFDANEESLVSHGKLVVSSNLFGNASNIALLEESGSVLFMQPYRHGNQTDTHFRVEHPFDPIYLYRPELGDEKPFATLPAVAAVYFLDEEHEKTWNDLGMAGLQLGLFAVGVGEVVVGLRAASIALQGSGLLSRQFLMAGIKTGLGTADLFATAASSYCDGEASEFCATWQKYEFYINLGLLTASVADGIFNKLQLEYPKIRDELDDESRRLLDEQLGKDLTSLIQRFDNLTLDELKSLFSKLSKSDIKTTSSKQWGASTANQNFKLEYISERVDVNLEDFIPPYRKGTFADEIVLAEDAFFVRVHNQRNQVGRWMMTVEEFKALTTNQAKFKDLFALPSMPGKVSLVKVPKGTKIWKGQVDGNKWGNGGGIQIQVDDWDKYLDDRDDWFHELSNL